MYSSSPEEIVSYWNDLDSRVEDEVKRITAMMRERTSFTGRPAHLVGNAFIIKLASEASKSFIELVAQKFRVDGWTVETQSQSDMGGTHYYLSLTHPCCEKLAEAQHIRYDSKDALMPRRSRGL